ncbi:MAG: hypothetical protein ACR2HA_09345, partial [Nocardioides sp.]
VQQGGPTTAGNAQGLAKNPHVVKDHPGVSVEAETPQPAGDALDELRCNAPAITWTMPTGHSYRLPPPPALDWGSRPSSLSAPPARDTKRVVDEIRSRLNRPSAPHRPDRSARQDRRQRARRARHAARLELAEWRARHQAKRRHRRRREES